MNDDEAQQYILDRVRVTRQQVTLAKAFMLKNFEADTEQLIDHFSVSVDARMPQEVVIGQTANPIPGLESAAEAISWKLAACEAIWGLISSAAIFPASTRLCGQIGTLKWTTGRTSSGWRFDDLSILVPDRLVLPRSTVSNEHQPLTDPDLYLKEMDLPGLAPVIESALREAVQCFRHDLYLACLAMLGRASEAAWIELGLALASWAAKNASQNAEKIEKQLQDPFIGIGKKIALVSEFYNKRDIFGSLENTSGVKSQELKNCIVWADCVRESRNSLHYGAEPAMSNSYEKVAALLIGAVPHIRVLARLTAAAS